MDPYCSDEYVTEPEAAEWEFEYAEDDDPEGNVYGLLRRVVGPWHRVESKPGLIDGGNS